MAVIFGAMTMTGISSMRAGKIFAGIGAGSIAYPPLLLVSVAHPQLGLYDARGFSLPVPNFIAAFVACGIIGLLVAVFIRPTVEPEDTVPAAAPVAVTESTRAAWFGRGHASWVLVLILGIAAAVTAVPTVFAIRDGDTGLAFALGASTVLMALLAWMFAVVRVRIDATGVRWSLGPGIPRGHIRFDAIRSVSAVELKPADWGGWGYRLGGRAPPSWCAAVKACASRRRPVRRCSSASTMPRAARHWRRRIWRVSGPTPSRTSCRRPSSCAPAPTASPAAR